jgi:hypothetical protein
MRLAVALIVAPLGDRAGDGSDRGSFQLKGD